MYRHCIYLIASIFNIRDLYSFVASLCFLFLLTDFVALVFLLFAIFLLLERHHLANFSDSLNNGHILRLMVCVKSVKNKGNAVNSLVIAPPEGPKGPSSQIQETQALGPEPMLFNNKYSTCLDPITGKLALSRREGEEKRRE